MRNGNGGHIPHGRQGISALLDKNGKMMPQRAGPFTATDVVNLASIAASYHANASHAGALEDAVAVRDVLTDIARRIGMTLNEVEQANLKVALMKEPDGNSGN